MATVRTIIGEGKKNVFSIDRNKSVHDAMGILVEHEIGAVIVMDGKKPVGMFTERDVLKCWAAKANSQYFREIKVGDSMTSNLIVVEPDDDLCYIMSIMIKNRIRHLPVVDKNEIVAMLSMRDVVKAQVTDLRAENHYLKEYLAADYPG